MNEDESTKEIIDAIANLSNRIEILERSVVRIDTIIDFLRARKSEPKQENESKWNEWARRLIVALIASVFAVIGAKMVMP